MEQQYIEIINAVSTVVVAVATFILTIITGIYLFETNKMRKIAEATYHLQYTPVLFIEKFNAWMDDDFEKGMDEIILNFTVNIKNISNFEARNVRLEIYVKKIVLLNSMKTKPIKYCFPESKSKSLQLGSMRVLIPRVSGTKYNLYIDVKLIYYNRFDEESSLIFQYEFSLKDNYLVEEPQVLTLY